MLHNVKGPINESTLNKRFNHKNTYMGILELKQLVVKPVGGVILEWDFYAPASAERKKYITLFSKGEKGDTRGRNQNFFDTFEIVFPLCVSRHSTYRLKAHRKSNNMVPKLPAPRKEEKVMVIRNVLKLINLNNNNNKKINIIVICLVQISAHRTRYDACHMTIIRFNK